MSIKSILVPLTGLDADRHALDAAAKLARRWDAHIDALHIRADGNAALPFLGDTASGALIEEIIDRIEKDASERAKKARADFGRWREGAKIADRESPKGDGPSCAFIDASGGRDTLLGEYGRCADITVFHSASARDNTSVAADIETVLMSSGRPLLLVPTEVAADFGAKAVVAWNDSVESANAVAAAMPLLLRADSVTVVAVAEEDNEATDLSGMERYLAWHGIKATAAVIEAGERPISEVLMERARRQEGAILVMGAYTHSRFREQVLGGVTQDVLDFAEVPVLMIH